MPWRNRYITTRRHPHGIAVYLLTMLMGVFFLTGVFDSVALDGAIGHDWQIAWQLLIALGGAVALAGVAWPQKRLEDGLMLESTGAAATGCGLTVYSVALLLAGGWSTAAWLLLLILAVGAWWRSVQARSDARRIEQLTETIKATQ